ncbi:MAG: hypothetical protein LBG99_00320 [Propionibacteriaceae bacterium]|jgi:hypothetical protein|nr:hypothetical protein [Propionibacteriaceae bacterium]
MTIVADVYRFVVGVDADDLCRFRARSQGRVRPEQHLLSNDLDIYPATAAPPIFTLVREEPVMECNGLG